MTDKDQISAIFEAREIARRLHQLLQEDTMHRLQLYQKYSEDIDALSWTPDLHHRASIAEALCKKLEEIIVQKCNEEFKKAV